MWEKERRKFLVCVKGYVISDVSDKFGKNIYLILSVGNSELVVIFGLVFVFDWLNK